MSPRRRRRPADDEPLLFDLPLVAPGTEERSRGRGRGRRPVEQPDLFPPPVAAADQAQPVQEQESMVLPLAPPAAAPAVEVETGPVVAAIGPRLAAGLGDSLLHLGVLAGVYLGLLGVGVEPRLGYWPAIVTLLVAFSFLQGVVSLAFWGQTAGMAWQGLQTRDRLQQPLSFRQAALRWLGGLLTCAGAGLPLLLALGGTSFTDWMSRSVTYSLAPHRRGAQ